MDEEELQSFKDTHATRTTNFSEPNSWNVIVPLSVTYGIIFVSGILGNISTCIVIGRNRSMYTITNCYLFSLAISDLLLLVCGLPLDVLRLWYPFTYPLGHALCIAVGLISETSTNCIILTITAFTIERYIAICRPFMPHQHSKLSRIVIYIIEICALCFAVPRVMLFGMVIYEKNGQIINACTVEEYGECKYFAISSFVFFVVPMSLITVLYVLIGIKLHVSRILHPIMRSSVESDEGSNGTSRYRSGAYQRKVIRMLVTVALMFFLCWAPFYVQRLIAIYGKNLEQPTAEFNQVYIFLTVLSGVKYYLSTAINPLLYNIMSNQFRHTFKVTLSSWCSCLDSSELERTDNDPSASQTERPPARPYQRSPHPWRLQRISIDPSQPCEVPPPAQVTSRQVTLSSRCSPRDRSWLERTDNDLLSSQTERPPARPYQRSPHPRRLQRISIDPSQPCEVPPPAQVTSRQVTLSSRCSPRDRSWLERTDNDLLSSQTERPPARPYQRSPHPRRLQRISIDPSLPCEVPPPAQVTLSSRCSPRDRSWLERTDNDLLSSQTERPPARPYQRLPHPRRLQRISIDPSQPCEVPPPAQVTLSSRCSPRDRSWLERTDNDLLSSQTERPPARPYERSPHPRRLQRISIDPSQPCEVPPSAQVMLSSRCSPRDRSWLERTDNDLLSSQTERPPARPYQRSPHPRRLQRISIDPSQPCEVPPPAQVTLSSRCSPRDRSWLERTDNDLLSSQTERPPARPYQRSPHPWRLQRISIDPSLPCEVPPSAQVTLSSRCSPRDRSWLERTDNDLLSSQTERPPARPYQRSPHPWRLQRISIDPSQPCEVPPPAQVTLSSRCSPRDRSWLERTDNDLLSSQTERPPARPYQRSPHPWRLQRISIDPSLPCEVPPPAQSLN